MAKRSEITSGKAGPVVFYWRNDKQFIRTLPSTVRRSDASIKSSKGFGRASKLASTVLSSLGPICGVRDNTRYQRFMRAFSTWLTKEQPEAKPAGMVMELMGLEINPPKMITEQWSRQINITANPNGLHIHIPEFVPGQMITQQKKAGNIKLNLASVVIPLADPGKAVTVSNYITIPYKDQLFPAQQFQHEMILSPQSLVLTGFSVEVFNIHGLPVIQRSGYNLPAWLIYAEWTG